MILNPDIENYIHSLLPARDPVLIRMEELAARENIPIVGPAVGRLLAQMVLISRARRIFELGSAIGYSTIWLARAAGPSAEVHYSDGDPANAERARSFFADSGVSDRIHLHVGDALKALSETPGEFDLIFNDVDKEGYPDVLVQAPPRLRPNGILITDNVLWHTRVLDPRDTASHAVVEFNCKLFERNDFWSCLIPLRDGLTVAVRTTSAIK
jgi:caffeoyl-CoA O-methyltransferase